MDAEQVIKLLTALEAIAGVVQRLGPSGLILVVLSGPALVLMTVLGLEYMRSRATAAQVETMRADQMQVTETMRGDLGRIVEAMRAESRGMLEAYRSDTQAILRELGADQAQTDQYYRDNVELVRQYERLAKDLVAVVTCNTKALERLSVIIETRGGCK